MIHRVSFPQFFYIPRTESQKNLTSHALRYFHIPSSKSSLSKSVFSPITANFPSKIHNLFYYKRHYSHSTLYNQTTKRVPLNTLKNLETMVEEHTSSLIFHTFLEAVQTGNWKKILSISSYPLYALKAFKEERLSLEDFATLLLSYGSDSQFKECISIFLKDGSINPVARTLIEQTFLLGDSSYLSREEISLFFELLRQENPIQTLFFLENPKIEPLFQPSTIRVAIKNSYLGFNFLSQCSFNGLSKCIIPSLAMMNCLLKAKFKNPVKILPVLGLSSAEDLEKSAKMGFRELGLNFPGISFPKMADSLYAEGTDFAYHDFFHAFLVSLAPPDSRNQFLLAANIIQKHMNSDHLSSKENLKKLYFRFVDMEFSFHYYDSIFEKKENKSILFLKDAYTHLHYNYIDEQDQQRLLKLVIELSIPSPKEKKKLIQWMSHIEKHCCIEIQELKERIAKLYKESEKEELPEKITNHTHQKIYISQILLTHVQEQYFLAQKGAHLFQKVAASLT